MQNAAIARRPRRSSSWRGGDCLRRPEAVARPEAGTSRSRPNRPRAPFRIARNVARGAALPEIRHKEAHFFERHDVDRIIEGVPAEYRGFIAVQGVLGLRFGEAAALRRRSVDLLHRRLEVAESLAEIGGNLTFGPTKTHAARKVPLPPSLLASLSEHVEERTGGSPDALLFTSARGFPIRYSRFRPTIWVPTLRACACRSSGCTRFDTLPQRG